MALSSLPNGVTAEDFQKLVNDLNQLATAFNALKAEFTEHTHGGVTTGSGDTGAGPTTAVADIALETT